MGGRSLRLVQEAQLYDWNGTPTASITEALSEAGLDDRDALYFPKKHHYTLRLLAVGIDEPIDTHRNIRRVYSEQRRVTFPRHLIESAFGIDPKSLSENPIVLEVYAGDGILGFKRASSTTRSLRAKVIDEIEEEMEDNLSSAGSLNN